jgi:regulator of sigma E protease
MSDLAYNFVGIVIGLGFLIFIHESGHFAVAKLFRVRVLVFSLGFGKRLFGFRLGETDYRVSIFPLGGYVRMSGDTPEETENVPPHPGDFLSKPKWQRFLILVAGPTMNILIALFIVAGLAMVGREEYIIRPVARTVVAGYPAAKAGLLPGDRIVKVNDEAVNDYDDVRLVFSINAGTPLKVTYVRNGVLHTTTMTPVQEEGEFGPIGRVGIGYGYDPIVNRTLPGSAAAAAGLRSGDVIVAANGKAVQSLDEIAEISSKNIKQPVTLEVARGKQILHGVLLPAPKDPADIVRGIVPPTKQFKLSLFPALRYSVQQNIKMLKLAGTALGRMVRGRASVKELSGPFSIAKISGAALKRSIPDFLNLVAVISLQLGVMNLLPIPVLDGGHIMILLIEGVARRDLSLQVKERIQQLGFAVLATLMIVVLYNDVITNWVRMRSG